MSKKSLFVSSLLFVFSYGLSGCAWWVVPEPSTDITIQEALKSVGEGLQQMQDAKQLKAGLIVSEVNIDFNISAGATDNAKLTLSGDSGGSVTTTTPGGSSATAKTNLAASGELGTTVVAKRGNTISVKFINMALIDKPDWDKRIQTVMAILAAQAAKPGGPNSDYVFGTDITDEPLKK